MFSGLVGTQIQLDLNTNQKLIETLLGFAFCAARIRDLYVCINCVCVCCKGAVGVCERIRTWNDNFHTWLFSSCSAKGESSHFSPGLQQNPSKSKHTHTNHLHILCVYQGSRSPSLSLPVCVYMQLLWRHMGEVLHEVPDKVKLMTWLPHDTVLGILSVFFYIRVSSSGFHHQGSLISLGFTLILSLLSHTILVLKYSFCLLLICYC